MILLGLVLLLTVLFTQGAVYFPVDFLFSLHLPLWFGLAIGLLLTAWLLDG